MNVSNHTLRLSDSFTQKDAPCCICRETLDSSGEAIVQTRCRHLMHMKCMTNWLNGPLSNRTCCLCRSTAVPLILVSGVPDEKCTYIGHPALMAASDGDLPTLKQLLAADPGLTSLIYHEPLTDNKLTLLMTASDGGHCQVVQYLLASGARSMPR